MITIIDYGLGNVKAFESVYRRLDIPVKLAKCSSDLDGAEKIILPGVGSFDWAVSMLDKSGMRAALNHAVLAESVPVLGVCVGMQIMAESSEEGKLNGLGWIPGKVTSIRATVGIDTLRLPHMGWNDVKPVHADGIFKGIPNPRFYFLHSYYIQPKFGEHSIAVTDYGLDMVCAVKYKNIYGTQFHPEKSHDSGVQLLRNFAMI
jgi:glutamine amidotransferase